MVRGKYAAPVGEGHINMGDAADKYYQENPSLFPLSSLSLPSLSLFRPCANVAITLARLIP